MGRLAVRRWWEGTGALPATLAGAELAILLSLLGLRATDLAQLSVALPSGLARSSQPTLDGGLAGLYLVESVGLALFTISRGRFLSAGWAAIDVSVALLVIAAEPAFTLPADRVGTWTAWGYAIGVGAAFNAGVGFPTAGRR